MENPYLTVQLPEMQLIKVWGSMWKKYELLPDLLYSFLGILYWSLSWTELQSDPVTQFSCTCITKRWGKREREREIKITPIVLTAWGRKLNLIFWAATVFQSQGPPLIPSLLMTHGVHTAALLTNLSLSHQKGQQDQDLWCLLRFPSLSGDLLPCGDLWFPNVTKWNFRCLINFSFLFLPLFGHETQNKTCEQRKGEDEGERKGGAPGSTKKSQSHSFGSSDPNLPSLNCVDLCLKGKQQTATSWLLFAWAQNILCCSFKGTLFYTGF